MRGPAVVVMGVAGSGKSTAGALVATRLGATFIEGDQLHPAANVAKMAAGVPLTDEDRRPWLEAVGREIERRTEEGSAVVAACSALKRTYRDILRAESQADPVFVYLCGSPELIGKRLARRSGHFFPASLLESQFATLEPPLPDERHVVADLRLPVAEMVESVVADPALGRHDRAGG